MGWCWNWNSNTWPPDVKNWLIGEDPDAGKDWRWEEKGKTEDLMVGWRHWLDGHEFEQSPGVGDGQGSLVLQSMGSQWVRHNRATELNWTELKLYFTSITFVWDIHILRWQMKQLAMSKKRCFSSCIKTLLGTSLADQWLRIPLPMQGAWVRSLVWEDPTDSLVHVQSRPTLWDPLDCSLPDSSVHRIVQARMLGELPFLLQGSSQTRDWSCISYVSRWILPLWHPGSPCALGQLSPCAPTTEPVLCNKRSHCKEH